MTSRPASLRLILSVFVLLLGLPAPAAAIDLSFAGKVQSDVRFRLVEKSMGGFWNPLGLPAGIERNQNLITFKLTASSGPFSGVLDLDFVWNAFYADLEGISDLTRYDKVSPYYLRTHAAYLEAMDLLPGLDLRVGQMIVNWGKGDQFNPTNNLNAGDIEDPLLFGEQLANLMAKVDYTFRENFSFSGVLVPLFKPAILPRSAPLGLAANDRLPFTSETLRYRIHAESALTSRLLSEAGVPNMRFPTRVKSATPVLPEASAANMQFAFRFAGTVADHDFALSYYNGRTDIPQPFFNYTSMHKGRICNPVDPAECVDGTLDTETYLGFPRVQVVGINLAGQIGWVPKLWRKLKAVGYRFELGLYLPQESTMTLLQERLDFGAIQQPAGEYAYETGWKPGQPRPAVVRSTPFAKWTLGLDYTFNRFVYANLMWVHGMADEFGAGDFFSDGVAVRQGGIRIPDGEAPGTAIFPIAMQKSGEKYAHEITHPRLGDYLVLGFDLKFLDDRGLFRLFTIWDLNGYTEDAWDPIQQRRTKTNHSLFSREGFSAVIFPELSYNFLNGLELGAGALLMLGRNYTKFGDPASGGSQIFTRARYSY